MSAILDFPKIEAPPLAVAPAPAPAAVVAPAAALPPTIKETVLAQFKEAETAVIALAEKYRDVAYDVSTTRGMNEAKAARLDLRENGRFLVQRAEKAVKADVNDLKRVMAEEVDRIVGLVLPVEEAIDAQIKAEEDRKAAAKAERERIESERVATHQAGIAKIRAYLTRCQEPGMTAERILTGIQLLAVVTFGPEWQDFAERAKTAQDETLAAMRALHTQAQEHEAAAAAAEAQRVENERIAAELAARQAELDAQAAELAERERAANNERDRIECLKGDVARIHGFAATLEGDHNRPASEIAEAIATLEQLDVSEATFQEFATMAADARRLVLAALLEAKDAAEAREASQNSEGQNSQQVLKAEASSPPDATDRETSADASPGVGPMGAEQPADAGLAEVAATARSNALGRMGASIAPEVESDSTPAGDLFGAAPAPALATVPLDVALADCREALREALLIVQTLVNDMDQTGANSKRAADILARVSSLRALGGI